VSRVVAMKCYGYDWLERLGLSEDEAADRLALHGCDWALLQNAIDPLPGSAVEQLAPAGHDEGRFRAALRERGMRVFETTSVFFQPEEHRRHPDLRPVADDGSVMEPYDWYVGLCPSSPDYLAERVELMERVVERHRPDGVFISFIRFPGFWELWLPGTQRRDVREYCFCERCLSRFQEETGVSLRSGGDAVDRLQGELRPQWTDWKCSLIAGVVAELGAAARRVDADIEVLLNGIALGADDLGGAAVELLGQDLGRMSARGEHVELMFYHQILARRPGPWIRELTAQLRPQVHGNLLACLQTKAAYLEPPYDPAERAPEIPIEECREALQATAESPADGVCIFHWADLVEDDEHGGRMGAAVREFKGT
jgi:hypothetical protein